MTGNQWRAERHAAPEASLPSALPNTTMIKERSFVNRTLEIARIRHARHQ